MSKQLLSLGTLDIPRTLIAISARFLIFAGAYALWGWPAAAILTGILLLLHLWAT